MLLSSMIDRGQLRERESRRRAAGSKSQPCWPAIARQGHAPHRSVWPHPDCDHDEGLHRSSATGQFTADFLGAKVLVGGRPSPASFVTATIARATLPGFWDWRSPAAQAPAERSASSIFRATAVAPGFESAAPSEIVRQVLGGDAVEAVEPLFEAAVVGVEVVDVQMGRFRGWLSRREHRRDGIPALRAKAAIGRPPSPIRWLSCVTTPASAAPTEAPST
jgi:hypothetical protein